MPVATNRIGIRGKPTPASQATRSFDRTSHTVWLKAKWGEGSWVLARYLFCHSATTAVLPNASHASFRYDFGEIVREGTATYVVATLKRQLVGVTGGIKDVFVAVKAHDKITGAEWLEWVGVLRFEQLILGATKDVGGRKATYGTQLMTARGLESLLERRHVVGAYAIDDQTGGPFTLADNRHVNIDVQLSFNRRGRGTALQGNRTIAPITELRGAAPSDADQSYVFGRAPDPSDNDKIPLWSWWDIIEYQLAWSQPFDDTVEPLIRLDSDEGSADGVPMFDFVNNLHTVVTPADRNVWEIIKGLIDSRIGIGAHFTFSVDPDTVLPEGIVRIALFPMTDELIQIRGITLPLNTKRANVAVDADIDVDRAVVTIDTTEMADKIIVQGEPVLSCFSVAHSDLAFSRGIATFKASWKTADETAYKASDDTERRRERFKRVYRRFVLADITGADVFDWQDQLLRVLNPRFDANGVIDFTQPPASYFNWLKGLERKLPLSEEADVSAEIESLQLAECFAVAEIVDDDGVGTGYWCTLHNPPSPDDTSEDGVPKPLGNVSGYVIPIHDALEFEIRIAPNHALGKNHFDPTEGGTKAASQVPVFDWQRMIATVAVRCDSRPRLTYNRPARPDQPTVGNRVIVINVQDAEVWVVSPGTITGVDSDGALVAHAGDQVVRDDTDRLARIMMLARSWYSKERHTAEITRLGIQPAPEIGTMIKTVLNDLNRRPINAPVVERAVDFTNDRTTIRTGSVNLDVVASRI